MTTTTLPPALRGILHTDPDALAPYATASGPFRATPQAVVRPRDTEGVVAALAWARDRGMDVVARGAGTGMPGGNVGRGLALDLSAFDATRSGPSGSGRVWAGAGATGAAIDAVARADGHFVPPLPSSAERCTVGGMVANNAAGARSFGYGSVRSWVEALDVVMADGTEVRLDRGAPPPPIFLDLLASLAPHEASIRAGWPDVRKNSSGYALDRFLTHGSAVDLLVGSEGTLGIVTRVLLRLAPTPTTRHVVLLPVPSLEELPRAVEAANRADATACEFLGARFLDVAGLRTGGDFGDTVGDAEALLMVELDDRSHPPAHGRAILHALAQEFRRPLLEASDPARAAALWRVRHAASPAIAERARGGLVSMQFIEDSVVPPTALPQYLRDLRSILDAEDTDAVIFGHAGDGNVHVNPLVDTRRSDWRERVHRILSRTATLVARLGGTLAGEHGDGRVRTPLGPVIWSRAAMDGFRTVKKTLDPTGFLNPGVVVPLSGQDPLEWLTAEGGRR
ncbi:MAG: FAD-binding oxidoreductase [Longimicrobiales bacterium]